MTSVSVRPVKSRQDLKKFVKLPWNFYKDDPAWVPPLLQERLNFLNPKKNPFFEHAEVGLFLAERNGKPVGRISAQIDRLHNQLHQDQTGFFGFFESENDPEVAAALLETAESWLQKRGMTSVRGPFSFALKDEIGFVIDGAEHPPYILTGHSPAYYPSLVEARGYQKVKDWFCWFYDIKPVPETALAIAEEVRQHPGLVIRELDPKHMERDVRILLELFNSAWSKNWGFIPMTEAEAKKTAEEFKLILDPRMVLIAEVNGDPAAICLVLPNLNEAIRDLNGRLFPFGLLKLLYRIKRRKIQTVRVVALGIKKEYRGSILGGLSVLLYVEIRRRGIQYGYTRGEMSLTLEDNEKINAGIEFMGGEKYKRYRIYEKKI